MTIRTEAAAVLRRLAQLAETPDDARAVRVTAELVARRISSTSPELVQYVTQMPHTTIVRAATDIVVAMRACERAEKDTAEAVCFLGYATRVVGRETLDTWQGPKN